MEHNLLDSKKLDQIISMLGEIQDALKENKKKRISPTEKKRIPIPDSEMTDRKRHLIAMMNKSGRAARNLNMLEDELIKDYIKNKTPKAFVAEYEIMKRFYAWCWVSDWEKVGRQWTLDLLTLLNNWDSYVTRAQGWLDKHGDVPGSTKPAKTYPEPEWEWRLIHEEMFKLYVQIWNQVTPERQKILIEQREVE